MLHGLCFGEEAGARNLVFFRVKWLQATMKRYLVCATGAAAVVPDAIGSFYVFCKKWLFLWCSSMCFLKLWLQIALYWLHECCMGYVFGEEAGARNLVVFPCKVAAGDDERYLVCATGAAAVVPDAIGSFYVFCNKWLFLWCSSMRFLKLWLQIALKWLHECCMVYVLGRKPEHETWCFSV